MKLTGNPVSHGIALGEAYVYHALCGEVVEDKFKGTSQPYVDEFNTACIKANAELSAMINSLSNDSDDKAKIFVAHQQILTDEDLISTIKNEIAANYYMPAYAVKKVYDEFIEILGNAKDPLIAARCADLSDVRNRLIRILHGGKENNLSHLPKDVIVVAHDLLPSDTATLDRAHVKGIITEIGSATSHSAIIARSYQIPAVLGVGEAINLLRDGDIVALDALEGTVYKSPDEEIFQQLTKKHAIHEKKMSLTEKYLFRDPLTANGTRIDIGINIGADLPEKDFDAYDFVGLFRTEFLYMENDHMPTEEEQFSAYKSVLQRAKGKPVTLRTLDIGGDKTLQYYDLPKELNPFLGKRALRLCLDEPEIFSTQLRAALRASVYGTLWLLFPMVSSVEDISRAKQMVETAKTQLRAQKKPFNENVKLGIMIEIPSIALIADIVAKEVDFASIGTNDLCQYTCAVDRMNPNVSEYYQSLSPAMLRIMKMSIHAFTNAGKPISVCGELGGDPAAAVALVGLGIRKLSMNSTNIASVKQALSKITIEQAERTAENLLSFDTEACVKDYLNRLL